MSLQVSSGEQGVVPNWYEKLAVDMARNGRKSPMASLCRHAPQLLQLLLLHPLHQRRCRDTTVLSQIIRCVLNSVGMSTNVL
eukprot:2823648-Amphidinium_carterae.1